MTERGESETRLDVVVVEDGGTRAIVPVPGADRLLAGPEGSVTVAGIRRAARRMRDEQDGRSVSSIAQAIIGGRAAERGARPCPPGRVPCRGEGSGER